MCVYTRTLSWTIVLRLWDQFFCEGEHYAPVSLKRLPDIFLKNPRLKIESQSEGSAQNDLCNLVFSKTR